MNRQSFIVCAVLLFFGFQQDLFASMLLYGHMSLDSGPTKLVTVDTNTGDIGIIGNSWGGWLAFSPDGSLYTTTSSGALSIVVTTYFSKYLFEILLLKLSLK